MTNCADGFVSLLEKSFAVDPVVTFYSFVATAELVPRPSRYSGWGKLSLSNRELDGGCSVRTE
jgi:hypothetical protein